MEEEKEVYQTAISKNKKNKKRGESGGPQKEEE
jgi:hypothetical protein